MISKKTYPDPDRIVRILADIWGRENGVDVFVISPKESAGKRDGKTA